MLIQVINCTHLKVVSFTQKVLGPESSWIQPKTLVSLFQNSFYCSVLILAFLCLPLEDETSELCLGLQTLLELKVRFLREFLLSVTFFFRWLLL